MSCQQDPIKETIRLLKLRLRDYDVERAGDRVTNAVTRGAVTGLALRGGLNAVSYLLRLVRGRKSDGRSSLQELVTDSLRWAAFLGAFSGTFVVADEFIGLLGGRKRTQAWRAMAAGAAAGPTLLLTGKDTTHTSLSLYIFIRGLALLVRCGNLPTAAAWKRKALFFTRWVHGDTALVCISTMQIGYSWIVLPSTLPPSYVHFLNKHGGKPLYVYQGVRELVGRKGEGGRLTSLQTSLHYGHEDPRPCQFLHPGSSCSSHSLKFFPEAYLRALPVYFPVYIIPAALVHRKRLINPAMAQELWGKVLIGACRSSAFLALYCSLAWRGACGGFQLTGRATGAGIAMSCWVAGLATLIEKKSRRMELALYCVSRAVESFFLCTIAWGWINPKAIPKRLDVLLFSAATACICHCYSDHQGARRDVFRSKYLSVFDFILGNIGFRHGSISHSPSNLDILSSWERRLEGTGIPLRLVKSMKSVTQLATLSQQRDLSSLDDGAG